MPFKKYRSESLDILFANVKFLCLTLWQGEVCRENDDDANDDDAQSMIVQGPLVDKPNEPKTGTKRQPLLHNICG